MTTDVFRFAEDGSNRMYVHGEEVVLASEAEELRATLRVVLSFGTTLPPDCRAIVLEALRR